MEKGERVENGNGIERIMQKTRSKRNMKCSNNIKQMREQVK